MERVKWLIHRLRAMGPAEMLSRVSDVGRHAFLYAAWQGGLRRVPGQGRSAAYLLPALSCNDLLQGVRHKVQERIVTEASQWLQQRGRLFELLDIPLDDSIVWHRDYSSGVSSPVKYSGFINHREAAEVGDVKYIWELNRLQHLGLLALAARWTGDNAYEKEIQRQSVSWCAQNPFMQGLNWKSPLEIGIRLISWAVVAFLTRGSQPLEELFHHTLRETIYQHQAFIRTLYAKHSSANNHLIGEMASLYIATVWWPWYRESQAWQVFAKRKLIQEMARQVDADGVGKERAIEYQLFILEFFLLAGALGQAIGDPFPLEYWEQIGRMLQFLTAISDRAGNLPMFGDGDSGQVIWLPESFPERAHTLVRWGQCSHESTDREDVRSRLLLWGQRPQDLPLSRGQEPAPHLQGFPQGGYYVLATDRGSDHEVVLVFNAGPLGLPPLYAHGHADALSFWLSYGGCEFLLDPGTFCYYTREAWRTYFRSTAAHNTVRIDGTDQSVPGGRFLWRTVAHCEAVHREETEDYVAVEGFHDGYGRLTDPVMHWREIRLYKRLRTVVITDRLECHNGHDVEVFFHFSESCQLQQIGMTSFEAVHGKKRLQIDVDSRLTPTLYRGAEQPIRGWVSRAFGVKVPAFTLSARMHITGVTRFQTKIVAV